MSEAPPKPFWVRTSLSLFSSRAAQWLFVWLSLAFAIAAVAYGRRIQGDPDNTINGYIEAIRLASDYMAAGAQQFQCPVRFGKLTTGNERAVARAQDELAKIVPDEASEDEKETLAQQKANAAVALIKLGTPEKIWPLLKFSPDPRVRNYIIHWFSPSGGDPQTIIKRLEEESDVTIRRALVLMLGEFTRTQLPVAQRQLLIEKLVAVFENEPDSGLHGAVEWLLRKWGHSDRLQAALDKLKANEEQLQARKAKEKKHWYINTQGQTFVILHANNVLMGSPTSEPHRSANEKQHRVFLRRRFAISATEVTKAQFARFQSARPDVPTIQTDRWVKTDDSPQTGMTWYEAAEYCNWLSEQEGIDKGQWYYEPNEQGEYGPGMKAKKKFWNLQGYRLPSEAEWEYACRAKTVTSRYYGQTEALLPRYAWYSADGRNRAWPAGSLKPNDFGIFDMLGNASEWCFDPYVQYARQDDEIAIDLVNTKPVEATGRRVLRGGAFDDGPALVRSAYRTQTRPDSSDYDNGFRVARTYP